MTALIGFKQLQRFRKTCDSRISGRVEGCCQPLLLLPRHVTRYRLRLLGF